MTQRGNLGRTLVVALTILTAVGGTAAAAPARPPTAEEKKAFTDGLRAYESGDARGAEKAWKAGYAVARDPAFLVRIGEAQEKAGAPKEALHTYEQYLRESPDAADHVDILARVQRLSPGSPTRAPVDVETPGELGGEGGAAPPGSAGTPTGPATGGTPDTKPSAGPAGAAPPTGAGVSSGDAAGAGSPLAAPRARTQARDENEDLTPIMEDESSRSAVNITAWVGAATTGALLGVAAFFGASASERAGDANRLLLYFDKDSGIPQEYGSHARQFEDDVRLGQRDDRLAKVFLIAAGATAIASAALFIVDARTEKSAPRIASGRPESRRRASGTNIRLRLVPAGLAWSF